MIVTDDGSEFTGNAILQWTGRAKVDWHYIARPAAFSKLVPVLARRMRQAQGGAQDRTSRPSNATRAPISSTPSKEAALAIPGRTHYRAA